MNLLAATVQIWAEARTAHIVKRNNFSPPPQVDSAILALELTPRISAKKLASYFAFVRALFKQPRKTILNNLVESGGFAKDSTVKLVEKIGLNPGARPQELDVALILKLLAQTEKLSEE
ncbi:MAG: hypothetical protein HY536_00115 [Candidatus Colwellbacteria bacterium]|nr:hypothetical protein [Candidatus Colwellbacteria bacterium]